MAKITLKIKWRKTGHGYHAYIDGQPSVCAYGDTKTNAPQELKKLLTKGR